MIIKRSIAFRNGKMFETIFFDDGWMIKCSNVNQRLQEIHFLDNMYSQLNIPIIN